MTAKSGTTQHQISVHAGEHLETTMTAGEGLKLASSADIQGMTMDKSGALLIQLSDGASVLIKNFAEVATSAGHAFITLPSGQAVNLAELIQTLAPSAQDDNLVANATPTAQVLDGIEPAAGHSDAPAHVQIIAKPHAHENLVVKLHAGEDYQFGFTMTDPASVKQTHGELVISFKDGGEIIIPNYGQMKDAGLPDITLKDGTHLAVADLGDTLAQASQLNQVEPAAGGAAGAHGGGFGFGSVFTADALHSLNPIGPLGPTQLQYATFDRTETGVPEIGKPGLEIADVFVKEDHSIALDISATLPHNTPNEHLTVTVTGIAAGWTVDTSVSGGTYDPATGTWSVTLPNGADFSGGPTLSPPANSDADLTGLQVTATATDGLTTATSTGVENVFTDAVVDPVTVTASNATGDENTTIPLSINIGASADTDGSEHVTKVVISGVPADATLNHGALQSDGTWLLSPGDLTGLTITPEHHFNGTINLSVAVTEQETNLTGDEWDTTDNTAVTTTDLSVTVNDTINAPNLSVHDVQVKEDHSIALDISANLVDPGPHDHLTVTVTGIAAGWGVDTSVSGGSYDAATGTWTVTLADGQNFSGGPTLSPPANSDADLTGLHVTATASDGSVSAVNTGTENVFTDAVVDPVAVTASDSIGNEDHAIPLSINIGASADTDGSEHVTQVVISGVPAGATLNHGALQLDGTWLLSSADVAGLAITPASHFTGDINLSVAVTEQETNLSGSEWDLTDNTAVTTADLTVHVNDTINEPNVAAHDVWVKEDGSIQLNVSADLVNPGPHDHLTVTISGIQAGWGVDTSHSGGAYDAATGTWTITLADGQNFSGGPIVSPPANTDGDMTGLTVTATASDGSVSATATTGENVFTDAVVDPVTVTAPDTAGFENHGIPLSITIGASADTDGSEHVTKVVISGVPTGATLNHGALQLDGTWLLNASDLSGLELNPVHNFKGDISLSVAVTEQETNLSGLENDLTDNTAVTTTKLTVHVQDDATPTITSGEDTVDETSLHSGNIVVADHVTADFFTDGPGTVTATGTGSFSAGGSLAAGALTSDGAAVIVSLSGDTYTGTANGHTVFTLQIGNDGNYTYTQDGTLDHADGANPNDVINLNFGVTATDGDGDTAAGNITIHVKDDAPVAFDDHNTYNIIDGAATGNVVTGLHGGPGAADTLSMDTADHVTQIQFGSTVVDVPTTGTASINGDHGTLTISADGSYTYTPNLTGGLGGTATAHTFTGNSFPGADLHEGTAIPTADRADLGELHSNMVIGANTEVAGNITFDGAGYTNSLGAFTIAADGTLQAVQMVASSITGAGANFSAASSASAQELGFFLVADGYTTNNAYAGLDFSHGKLNFVYDYGQADQRAATINDAGSHVSLVFTDATGHDTTISGPIYYTTDRGGSNSLNPDGVVHTISGVGSDSNTLTIGFEDLPNGGDNDYNDVVFNVQMSDVSTTDITDHFTYTLTDGDGDTSKANLYLDGVPPTVAAPVVTAHDVWVKEDGGVQLQVSANLVNPAAHDHLTVTITGIQAGWTVDTTASGGTYNAATGTWTVTLPDGVNFSGGPVLHPPANTDGDLTGLTVTATTSDGLVSASATTTENVFTDAVVDPVTVTAHDASGLENHSIALSIAVGASADTDGSEHVTKVVISGVPAGATLNHGTLQLDGTWLLSKADLSGLTLTPAHNYKGDIALTVAVTEQETNLHGLENDLTDNTAVTTTHLNVHVNDDATPTITNGDDTVDETSLHAGNIVVADHVTANFFTDGPGTIAAAGGFTAGGSLLGGHLTSDGAAVIVSLAGNIYTGTANGHTVFTLAVGNDGSYTYTQDGTLDHADGSNPNDVITLNFGVTATDGDGDTAAGNIAIHVKDDAPVAFDDHNTYNIIDGAATGNVVTGLHGGAGAADTLSMDAPDHVTQIQFGATTVNVPTTGTASINGDHGTLTISADGTYTYTPFAGTTAGSTSTQHSFTGNSFPGADLHEGVAIPTADQADLGEAHSNMVIGANTQMSGQITFDGAGYTNSLGAFTIAADGTLQAVQMVASSITGTGANFSVASSASAQELGFFLVADGYTTNNAYAGLDFSHGKLNFVYDYGAADQRAATINDGGSHVSLVFTDATGHDTVISGPIYYTSDRGGSNSLNPDGVVHTISGVGSDSNTLTIGFEDLPNGGDKDYNDAIFSVKMTDVATSDITDHFTYTLTDGDGDTSKANLYLDGIPPNVTAPSVAAHDVWVKEDGSVQLQVTANLANPAAHDHLTVTITGIQAGWTVDTTASGGTYNAATGTWTVTLPDGVNFSGGPVLHPPANSDADLTGLTVTATTSDGYTSATSTATESVFTDAVVDPVTVTAHDASGLENHSIALSIAVGASADTDGSEHVTKVVISGVPAGATLNHGTLQLDGTWLLSKADLTGLTLTPAHNFKGDIAIGVAVTEQETSLHGLENDLTDNTAVTTTHLNVHVNDDGTPTIIQPCDQVVDETSLHSGSVSVSDQVSVDFHGDGPGVIAPSGAGTFSADGSILGGHLTSGGQPVTVTLSGDTYTGTANGHEVFTLQVHNDGNYTFDLLGTLDHADGSNPNDAINLHFGVTATDGDGDAASTSITVAVLDDAPVAHDDHNTFAADQGYATGNVVSGLNGGAGAADFLSEDATNHVTQISYGSTTVTVPSTGTATIDGQYGELKIAANGTYDYTLFSGATGTSATVQHSFTGNSFPGDLQEGVAISTADRADLGELHSNMVISANTQVSGHITFDGAGYTNSLGAFTIAADGTLEAAQMIAPSITGAGANFSFNAATQAQELGFFLVANGYNTNNNYSGLDFAHGQLNFVYDYGQADERTATANDNGSHISLVFTDTAGHDTTIGGPIYYTTDRGGSDALNADTVVHTISGVGSDSHTLTIGFEDLPEGGDNDYNDTVFNVQMTDVTPATNLTDNFQYTLTDGDGDSSKALLQFDATPPQLIVGQNVNDVSGSTTAYAVGGGSGEIHGGSAGDILIGDVGGSTMVDQTKNYNVELVVDVSGSMGSLSDHTSKYYMLVQAVDNLLADFHNYHGGSVTVNITPFDTTAHTSGAFTVTGDTGYAAALDFLQHMGGGGTTNYESALQSAISWFHGSGPTAGADNFTYFITDGEPNHYVTDTNPAASGTESQSMAQIEGADGTNEISQLQSLSDVVGVGINVGTKISNIDLIDTSGHAINVHDPADLSSVLAGASPLNHLAAVGGDVINGGDGNDVIFGDTVNTDALAAAHGLSSPAGSGWNVFASLESSGSWTRGDTVNYIETHLTELGQESVGSGGARSGGNDALDGGNGDDVIFGQEGNDKITGGAGNDTLYGGSGADTFVFHNAATDGVDHIQDFNAAQGDKIDISNVIASFDPLTDSLHNFVGAVSSGTDTLLQVDTTGTGTAFHTIAVIAGVHTDVDSLVAAGNLIA